MHVVVSRASAFKFLDQCARLVPSPEYRFPIASYSIEEGFECARAGYELSAFATERFSFDGCPIDILVPVIQVTDEQLGDSHQLRALAYILDEYGVPRVA